MKTRLLIFSLLVSGLVVKAQSANNNVGGHPAATGSGSSSGFGSPGCVELGGSISYTDQSEYVGGVNNGASIDIFTLTSFVGYFPIKGLELGLDPFSYTSAGVGGGNSSILHALFAPAYNFKSSMMVHFFLEGEIGINHTTDGAYGQSEGGLSYGGRLGLKVEIAPHAMLNIYFQFLDDEYNYPVNPYPSPPVAAENAVISNLIIGVGFTEALYK